MHGSQDMDETYHYLRVLVKQKKNNESDFSETIEWAMKRMGDIKETYETAELFIAKVSQGGTGKLKAAKKKKDEEEKAEEVKEEGEADAAVAGEMNAD